MKIYAICMLVLLSFACKSIAALEQQNNLKATFTQSKFEKKYANIKVLPSSNGNKTYIVKLSKKWAKGICKFQGTGKPHAFLSDLNFDGSPDIWITGFTNSQGRSRCSDVWLFNKNKNEYEYNSIISKINNLEVAPLEKKLGGGVSNCGCAGQCFYHEIYNWQFGSLLKIARREQQCDIDTITYKEFILIDGKLKPVLQVKGMPNSSEYLRRQNGELQFSELDLK